MVTERLPMRKTREILRRLKWALHRSNREATRSLGVSAGVVRTTDTHVVQRMALPGTGHRGVARRVHG